MATDPGSPSRNDRQSAEIPILLKFITTGFGAGYSPLIPGTAGTAVGLLLYLIPGFESLPVILGASITAFAIGIYGAHLLEKEAGHDPGIVVIDEIVGFWVSLAFLPKTFPIIAAAFVLFRITDIIKPWPARWCQKQSGGWAVMLDDVIAGIYVNAVLEIAVALFR